MIVRNAASGRLSLVSAFIRHGELITINGTLSTAADIDHFRRASRQSVN
jgi:hypothetical protein